MGDEPMRMVVFDERPNVLILGNEAERIRSGVKLGICPGCSKPLTELTKVPEVFEFGCSTPGCRYTVIHIVRPWGA